MPGHLVSSDCEYAYFPYCRNNHEPKESWRTTDNCNLPKIEPSYILFATQRQFLDMDMMHVGDLSLDDCAKQAYELRSAGAYFGYDTCSSEKCPCYIYTTIRDHNLQERPGNIIYRLDWSTVNNGINVFEAYIAKFAINDLYVERMRQAIPDKYRGWTVKVEKGTYVTEYQMA